MIAENVVHRQRAFMGISVGTGQYLRDVTVSGNVVRTAGIGIGVSVVRRRRARGRRSPLSAVDDRQ